MKKNNDFSPGILSVEHIGREIKRRKMSTIQQLSQQSASSRTSGLSVWMQQHPIAAYFTLAFAITWVLHTPMALGKQGLGIFSYEVPEALFVILFILGA